MSPSNEPQASQASPATNATNATNATMKKAGAASPSTKAPAPPTFLGRLRALAQDWFLIGMVLCVVIATIVPDLGRSEGILRLDKGTDIGIFLVFLLHGLGLSVEHIQKGMARVKLHLLVQASTFVFFPLLSLLLVGVFGRFLPPALGLGFYYLCALPSTISSSVAMTAAGRGNVPGAIFNAALSSVIGVVATPFLMSFFGSGSDHAIPLAPSIWKLCKMLLVPLLLGQVLRRFVGGRLDKHKKVTTKIDRVVILLLVLNSFSDSVRSGLWTNTGALTLVTTLLGAGLVLACALAFTTRMARLLGLPLEDEVAAVFCGSKKTLASGVPMLKLLFGAHPQLGLIALPIMFYHQAQLFVCAILAERYARRAKDT